MYKSVGKASRSAKIILRSLEASDWMRKAVAKTLNKLPLVVSVTATSSAWAPTNLPTLLPMSKDKFHQLLVFQLLIKSCSHSCSTTAWARALAVLGRAPNELPSK